MELVKIMIADRDDTFCWALQRKLQENYHVCVCNEGMEAVELLHRFSPDIAIVDLALPGLNGMELIRQMEKAGKSTKFLWMADTLDVSCMVQMGQERMEQYLQKPFPSFVLVQRLEAMVQGRAEQEAADNTRKQIAQLLLALKMPVKLKGYRYVKEAIYRMGQDPQQSITKELYPAVAASNDATAQQVERAIRGAICAAWDNREAGAWEACFGPSGVQLGKKPTNAEFIRVLAEKVFWRRAAA